MGDSNTSIICESLLKNETLTYLNLSKNEITNHGLKSLISLLTFNHSINILFLHWNRILGKGGSKLAQALGTNTSL